MKTYDAIPAELKALPQWVCSWDTSKIPMRAFERKAASSVDPASWADFDTAVASVEAGYYDHIGFVFADTGIVGIDIDCGFEDGFLTPLCADIIHACRSYTERSKSGRGVHILLKGDLPFYGKNNRAGVEIYRSRRFFVTTGKALLYRDMIENQAGIDYVVEKYFSNVTSEKVSSGNKPLLTRYYSPTYRRPENGRIFLRPIYPEIKSGGRNNSLASLAGQMHSTGYPAEAIYKELLYVNSTACKPPLPPRDIQCIVESITRYRR
jgi:hypothetical protein